jgi:NADH-quinone oxidoreductase subunit E
MTRVASAPLTQGACEVEALRVYDFRNLHYRGEDGVLIPLLQKVQTEEGYISRERIGEIHRKTGVPLSQIFGVATFYAQFRLHPVGRNVIKVCHGTACHVAQANGISQTLRDHLQIGEGETTLDREFTLETVSCLGCCSLAPVIMINKDTHGNLKPTDLKKVLRPYRERKGKAGS